MTMFEQRTNGRYDYSGEKVEYVVDPFSEDEPFQATVLNFNESGLCFLSSEPLAVEQEITIKNFLNYSSRSAVVLWVEQYDDMYYLSKNDETLYRVGLSFV